MVIHLTSPDNIQIYLLKPIHDFFFQRLTQNWFSMITNALRNIFCFTRLTTSVDNSRRLAAVSLTVTEIEFFRT